MDVALWYNAGNTSLVNRITNIRGYSFNLSANNVSVTFVKQPLYFTGKPPFTGVVFRTDALSQNLTLNVLVPLQLLPHTYEVKMNTIGLNETISKCSFTQGQSGSCLIINDTTIINQTPAVLNFILFVTNPASGEVTSLPIQSLTYVESVNILKPYLYALSYSEYSTRATITYELDHVMDATYSYQCFVYSLTMPSYVVPAVHSTNKILTCKIKSYN